MKRSTNAVASFSYRARLRAIAGTAACALALSVLPAAAQTAKPQATKAHQVFLDTKDGRVVIQLRPDLAPKHVAQIEALTKRGFYDGIVFHRVIDGFMAQTGDVQYGKAGGDLSMAGMGGSGLPDIPAEFSSVPFDRGVVGMARSQDPNSANSQFFIMFAPAPHLDGQYTAFGRVISGMDVVDAIKKGEGGSGSVSDPDVMVKVTVQP